MKILDGEFTIRISTVVGICIGIALQLFWSLLIIPKYNNWKWHRKIKKEMEG